MGREWGGEGGGGAEGLRWWFGCGGGLEWGGWAGVGGESEVFWILAVTQRIQGARGRGVMWGARSVERGSMGQAGDVEAWEGEAAW